MNFFDIFEVGYAGPPAVIAELSANHNGSLEQAKKVISLARTHGADAIKLQTYTPGTMTLDCKKKDFQVVDGIWAGSTLFELYQKAQTPFDWQQELFEFARKIGIFVFSTPFDETAVDLLERLDAQVYKIASFEITDVNLIAYVSRKKKPVIMSTGMASYEEIASAVDVALTSGASKILLMHCISEYPAPPDVYNVRAIENLRNAFKVNVGLSDHSLGHTTACAATALGAVAIEKHFIERRSQGGVDSSFSMEPLELRSLKDSCVAIHECLGNGGWERSSLEQKNQVFRRSLYYARDLKKGEILSVANVKIVRPGYGLSPELLPSVLNRSLRRNVEFGDRVRLEDLTSE